MSGERVRGSRRTFIDDLLADSSANVERPADLRTALRQLISSRGVQVLTLYRVSNRRPGGITSALVHRLLQLVFTVDIDPRARVAPGVMLRHPMCLVIGSEVEVGEGSLLFHGVTIAKRFSGSSDRPDGMPRLDRNVLVGAQAILLGPITVGEGAIIGAGSIVTSDVPAGATVVGNPARVLHR